MTVGARVDAHDPGFVAQRPLHARLRAALASAGGAIALRGCDAVGQGVRLVGRPVVESLGRITIGDRFHLASRPVVSHLVTGPAGAIEIGDDVSIGHGAAITSHVHVHIGDRVRIGAFVQILDTDFHEVGDHHAAPEPKPISIGPGARIGSRVTILRGAVIGAGAEVLAGSVVAGEVAAGARVAGVPARPVDALASGTRSAAAPTMDRVREVIVRTFGLPAPPADSDRPDMVQGWDSLGTLNLLLSLEEEFDVLLEPQDLLTVHCVGDLLAIVEAGADRARATHRGSVAVPSPTPILCQQL